MFSTISRVRLPKSIGNLFKLKRLILGDNRIDSLPDSIEGLQNLSYLNLDRNLLTHIPHSLANLTQISQIWLTHNPLTNDEVQWLKQTFGNRLRM